MRLAVPRARPQDILVGTTVKLSIQRGRLRPLLQLALVTSLAGWSIACDQMTKGLATSVLKTAPPKSYFQDVFRLLYAENPGAFLNLGADLPASVRFWILTVGLGVMLLALVVFAIVHRRLTLLEVCGLALMAGGGAGNWLDRVRLDGVVVDFMNVGLGGWRTGVFNVADLAIECGCLLLIVAFFMSRRPTTRMAEETPPAT